jgi:dephospho-CoA kinase
VLKVGLTGNVASGKSSVARVWREQGVRVIDADELARRAVERGTPGLARIVAEWGTGLLTADGKLDRAALRDIVFRDAQAKAKLESIVHPEVERLRDVEYHAARAAGEALVVADIPLLFEVGAERECDLVVLVDAPEELRLERMVQERGLDPEEARRIAAAQMPSAQKRERANFVITNTGSMVDLEARAREVLGELRAQADAARDG